MTSRYQDQHDKNRSSLTEALYMRLLVTRGPVAMEFPLYMG